ncbi:unnamed protein product [Ceutorhynchus assimilis]|uniref:BMP and activin membrane-bound inhibitor homolog n=1 Tax=Ceutorhynchus assimilis TaxID=467358 RepID=A0A9P0GLR3_9CUCU|nr:unnamed protein product [Ceutorhynchus assimilis]
MSRHLNKDIMLILISIFLSVIISGFAQEESVSINRPRVRTPQQPWDELKTDQVRCFCNLPSCVATGYMCKSSSGDCFSDLLDSSRGSAYRGRHGCIEYLSESKRSRCPITDKDGQVHTPNKEHPRSLLVCCRKDMCNHIDNPITKNLLNNSLDEDSEAKFQHQDLEPFLYSNSEVWFRAATIAVPICGAVILFALIALAVKMLKKENQNLLHHKLGSAMYVPSDQKQGKWSENPYKPSTVKRPFYHQAHPHSFVSGQDDDLQNRQFQIPLLVTNEIRDFSNLNSSANAVNESKNDTNAKFNLMHCESNSSRSIIMEIGKSTPDYSLAANINLNSEEEKFCTNDKTFMS